MGRRKSLDEYFKLRKKRVISDSLGMEGELKGLEDEEGNIQVSSRTWFRKKAKTPRMTADELNLSKRSAGQLLDALRKKRPQYESLTDKDLSRLLDELDEFTDELYKNIIED